MSTMHGMNLASGEEKWGPWTRRGPDSVEFFFDVGSCIIGRGDVPGIANDVCDEFTLWGAAEPMYPVYFELS